MILTAHQPVYLPWLGLFQKIQAADLFCVFDIVQYQKKDFNNRNKIKLMGMESRKLVEKKFDVEIINKNLIEIMNL